jgi:hypothetical protein
LLVAVAVAVTAPAIKMERQQHLAVLEVMAADGYPESVAQAELQEALVSAVRAECLAATPVVVVVGLLTQQAVFPVMDYLDCS